MEVRDIFELRRQGRIEEAYEAIRPMYAVHKGKYTTLCMFWTANDILKKRILEMRHEEAMKIFLALMRVAPNIDDKDGKIHAALLYDALRLSEEVPTFRMLDFLEQYGVEHLTESDWKNPPQPSLAQRMLNRAFLELQQQPSVDDALKAMPLLTEALRRNPEDKQGRMYKEIVQGIIVAAEASEAHQQPVEKQRATPPSTQRTIAISTSHSVSKLSLHNTMSQKDFGRWGEEVAADYLEGKGYRILERDWRSGHRDIDIIARNVDSVIFVEVKTRRTHNFGEPYEAVDSQKQHNLLASINHYIHYKRLNLRPRFDIISIVAQDLSNPEIEHFEDISLV